MKPTLPITQTDKAASCTPRLFLCMSLLFFYSFCFAQLPAFNLNVVETNETCPGNGTITCTVTDTDPAATIVYRVYLLPDTATPIAVLTTTNFVDGLASGDYRIIATQTLGADSNTQTADVTIADDTIPLLYTIAGTNVSCGNNGAMTINTFSGEAVAYEIISGPMTAPLQTSEFFTGLAAGEYQVRVFDVCGQGWVITHTLFESTGNFLEWAETDQWTLVSCNEMIITNALTPGLNETLSYPITVTYTIHPPGGGTPIVQTTTMTSGDVSEQEFTTTIPYYSNQVYTYSVTVTDGCGNGYYFDNILINKNLLVELRSPPAECGEYYLLFAVQYYVPPFTITFTDMPTGFDPTAYNAFHPGPYSTDLISYGGTMNGVPFGHYAATITDSCGHSVDVEATLEYNDPEPQPDFEAHEGCDSNISDVNIKVTGYILNSAVIVSGPPEYSATYPIDVGHLIDPALGNLEIPNMNVGTYLIVMTDTCGNTYNYELLVVDPGSPMNWSCLVGCEPGYGSVRINAMPGVSINSVSIIAAPATYTATLPQNVSFNISPTFAGVFSMASLPEGDYTFEIADSCGFTRELTVTVIGYVPIADDTYNVIKHCGSFDIDVHFIPTGAESVTLSTLWLQRYDPITNTWGNPQTGVAYNPGDIPDNTNSYRLFNRNGINYNIAYLGDFRILNRFQIFGNAGTELFKICIEELFTFTVLNEIEITAIQKTTCNGLNSDVSITAIGVPPLTYQITSMNSQPYFVDNGNNNIFSNLGPAVYNFRVLDDCGNITNELTDVALLPSLVSINQPDDLVECDADNDNRAAFNLSGQNSAVLGGATPSDFTISYHLSLAEATTASNPLPDLYVSGTREIFVRMQYRNVTTCFDTASFFVFVNEYPELDMALSYAICQGENVTITADAGFDSYLWSTGETTPTITVDEPGTYTLEVSQTTNGVTCTATISITVDVSQPANIQYIETTDWTNDQNTISVILAEPSDIYFGPASYLFSLDNVNFQTSNTFYGLEPGVYTVYVKEESGCESVSQEVYLLAYPKFFTPNNDGYNDFWQIYHAEMEPDLKVHVFDRYGKLLKVFGSSSLGWDGKYNGRELPSTDYWFLVIRQNGKEHRGHFSMKR